MLDLEESDISTPLTPFMVNVNGFVHRQHFWHRPSSTSLAPINFNVIGPVYHHRHWLRLSSMSFIQCFVNVMYSAIVIVNRSVCRHCHSFNASSTSCAPLSSSSIAPFVVNSPASIPDHRHFLHPSSTECALPVNHTPQQRRMSYLWQVINATSTRDKFPPKSDTRQFRHDSPPNIKESILNFECKTQSFAFKTR